MCGSMTMGSRTVSVLKEDMMKSASPRPKSRPNGSDISTKMASSPTSTPRTSARLKPTTRSVASSRLRSERAMRALLPRANRAHQTGVVGKGTIKRRLTIWAGVEHFDDLSRLKSVQGIVDRLELPAAILRNGQHLAAFEPLFQ